MQRQVEHWGQTQISDERAKLILYAAFVDGKLEAPRTLLSEVHRLYFEPEYPDFSARTMWSLSNAFTSASYAGFDASVLCGTVPCGTMHWGITVYTAMLGMRLIPEGLLYSVAAKPTSGNNLTGFAYPPTFVDLSNVLPGSILMETVTAMPLGIPTKLDTPVTKIVRKHAERNDAPHERKPSDQSLKRIRTSGQRL